MLGFDSSKIKVLIYQMITFMEGGEPTKMSKRSGKALSLDQLIEELGADVVRFFFLMRGINTQLEFDLDLAREHSEKNPVFYLQYAHARIAGVLRHAESEGVAIDPTASLSPLTRPEEISLIRQILAFARPLYDWTLVDLGRSLSRMGMAALEEIDEAVLVTTLEVPALHQSKQIIQTLLDGGYGKNRIKQARLLQTEEHRISSELGAEAAVA